MCVGCITVTLRPTRVAIIQLILGAEPIRETFLERLHLFQLPTYWKQQPKKKRIRSNNTTAQESEVPSFQCQDVVIGDKRSR